MKSTPVCYFVKLWIGFKKLVKFLFKKHKYIKINKTAVLSFAVVCNFTVGGEIQANSSFASNLQQLSYA